MPSPTASDSASFAAVSFLHRFGSALNPHYHFHLCVVDGVFERIDPDRDPEAPTDSLRFHEATALTPQLLERLQHTIRKRVLRQFRRHHLLEPHEAEDMLTWDHGGGFSLDGSVRIGATGRAGLERLIRYCARPPFALDRLHLVDGRSDQVLYILPKPDPDSPGQGDSIPSPAPPSKWAALLARIYEVFPLICPSCQTPLTFIAFLTDPVPIAQILAHIREPTSPPLLHPARGPPQTDFDLSGLEPEEVARG